ncbi:uncharacterized protein prr14 [Astyanax mexicanus]|uniref:uncharacterized protein prr14 n=1 Tax=Astyanax mexicanus TaxID=7994 RepID=UPI0020CB3376|nr:uncharacterized protein prr14 [Astyanax mexicanus]
MLTSSQEHIPLKVTPMEEDVLCAVRHAKPQIVCHSSVLHSRDEVRGSSPRRRSDRLLRSKDQPEEKARPENSAGAPAQRLSTSLVQKEKSSRKCCENTDEIQWPGDKTLRSCKRKLELTMPSHISSASTIVEKHSCSSVEFESKCTGSPPPAKRWVIGPLFQSLKSKMASFTEIVMSPVRLFKPNDSSLSDASPSHCEQLTDFNKEIKKECSSRAKEEQVNVEKDDKDEVFSKEETICTPQSTVVQRLRFNTHSSNVSDSVPQSENESSGVLSLPQSVPENDSSNPRDLSTQFEEPIESSSVQEQISQDKPEYKKEVHTATSTSEQTDMSNLAQEKFGCTNPKLIVELTDMAHTLGIRSPIHEAPHQNTSSFSSSLTEDVQKKDLFDCKEPSLKIPIRTSPRKTMKLSSKNKGMSVKSGKKGSATLSEALDYVKPGLRSASNSKAHVQHLSKDKDVLTPVCETEKKRKDTPNTFSVRGLEKEESVKKVTNSSKRTRKECKFDHMDESPTVTLTRIDGNVTSVGKRKKVQVTDSAALRICNASVVVEMIESVPESSGNEASVEKQKIGQNRASRSKSRRDAQCRTPAVLGSKNNVSDHSSSSDAMKSALMDNSWQGKKTDLSDYGADIPVEARQSIRSVSPQKMAKDEPSVMSTRSRKMRQCKVMLCKIRKTEDLETGVETHSLAGKTKEPLAKNRHQDCEEMINASDHEHSKITLRNHSRQAKHKLETSSAASVVSSNWPAIKKPTVSANKSENRAAKRATDELEEQRVSMSLTLQVDTEAPVHSDSTAPWQTARQVHCRTTRRLGKVGTPAVERNGTSSTSKSTSMYLNDQDLLDQGDGHLSKTELFARKERKLKVDKQRRRCTSLAKKIDVQDDGVQTGNLKEVAVPVVSLSGSGSSRLLRSFSCPDIPSFLHSDYASLPPLHDPVPPSPPKKSCPAPPHTPHPHSPSKRARRHTVCSVEIEREIAPLCLRKEVCPYSHSSSLTALASTFLSSPLAFLSKKSSQGCSGDYLGLARTSPRRFKSSSPFFLKSPTSPTLTANPAFSASVPHTPEQSSASVSSPCSVLEPVPMEADVVQQVCEECEEDEQSNFSLELSSRVDSEEKALSDSEIKTDDKQMERRKVSSIRIRKTLPKPQYNLTPMGLPKAIRIKKKVFSVEEIYTNKNFSKPPEGRLETIFEMPLSRRDGSESLIGLKRMKRFVEFPELGVARKPKKPLVGAAGVGAAQRKAAGNCGVGRTRRGVGASFKEEETLTPQDLDSLLCSKLNELDLWMAIEQVAY